jgi:hypothetical protein
LHFKLTGEQGAVAMQRVPNFFGRLGLDGLGDRKDGIIRAYFVIMLGLTASKFLRFIFTADRG